MMGGRSRLVKTVLLAAYTAGTVAVVAGMVVLAVSGGQAAIGLLLFGGVLLGVGVLVDAWGMFARAVRR